MTNNEKFAWSWEPAAMDGEPMPDGLSLHDQMAYAAMRYLYAAFRAKLMSREQAAAEKQKIRRSYSHAAEQAAFDSKLTAYQVRVIRATERAQAAVRCDPSAENALRLCDILDGINLPPEPQDPGVQAPTA